MVISIRVPDEQANLYRAFAEQQGLSLSDFIRQTVDSFISETEAAHQRQLEKQAREEQIRLLVEETQRMAGFMKDTAVAAMSDQELEDLVASRYA